jgi:pyruvate ferredoxin oxidoreductase beta subunit
MIKLKDLAQGGDLLSPGHRLCPGCGVPPVMRMTVNVANHLGYFPVIGIATGCLEVSSTIFPYTAWRCSFIHNAFENSAATVSGAEAAYRSLMRRGKIKDKVCFIAVGGDGGTYDIGLQSLSGAMERGHNMVYICYDNEAYQNTGNQRSSSTPMGSNTTTTPVGKVSYGRKGERKDLTAIMAAHHIPYVAQGSMAKYNDLIKKLETAITTEGPCFLNVLCPCVPGWKYDSDKTLHYSRLAHDTCFWPHYEVINGKWVLNSKPKEKLPIEKFLEGQGRFRHLFRPQNKHVIEALQAEVDKRWEEIQARCQ